MKTVQKYPLPTAGNGAFNSLALQHGAKVVGIGYDNGWIAMYVEQAEWSSGSVYWEIQVVREGEQFADGMQVLGMAEDPNNPVGYGLKLFVVGRING
jgi:hypothetical protein